jgi:hypothetical protein
MWPSARHLSPRHAVIMLMLVGSAGLALAVQSRLAERVVAASDSADIPVADETTGSLGNGSGDGLGDALGNTAARPAAPELSDEDRFHIYEGVMRIPDAPTLDEPAADVADALPDEVPLQDMPISVARKLPQVKDLKFVKLDDRILVVNPESRVVVAMIPRYKLIQ